SDVKYRVSPLAVRNGSPTDHSVILLYRNGVAPSPQFSASNALANISILTVTSSRRLFRSSRVGCRVTAKYTSLRCSEKVTGPKWLAPLPQESERRSTEPSSSTYMAMYGFPVQ